MSLSILLCGAGGRMGRAITEISEDHDCTVTCPIDLGDDPSIGIKDCDVVIDFSLKSATLPLAKLSAEAGSQLLLVQQVTMQKKERK